MFKATLITLIISLSTSAFAMIQINGAGATFPYPLYSKWFLEYSKNQKEVRFNYQSIGSGGGVRQLLADTVDFGASDVPMKEKDLKKSKYQVLHVPTALGAVSVAINLPEVKNLKLTGEALAKIYLGDIKKWDDPLIKELNPTAKLPPRNLLVVHRSDGSGTTAIFTDYLSNVSPKWEKNVGTGKAVKWPKGVGGKGNEGVTGILKQMKGSIGYVELAYALQNKLTVVALKNKNGKFTKPSLETITASAESLATAKDYKKSIVNSPGDSSYPITAMTFLLIPLKKHEGQKKEELKNFLKWAMGAGQDLAPALHYAPLPAPLRKRFLGEIGKI
jgi:phosphate transport system substrate-binding protein